MNCSRTSEAKPVSSLSRVRNADGNGVAGLGRGEVDDAGLELKPGVVELGGSTLQALPVHPHLRVEKDGEAAASGRGGRSGKVYGGGRQGPGRALGLASAAHADEGRLLLLSGDLIRLGFVRHGTRMRLSASE